MARACAPLTACRLPARRAAAVQQPGAAAAGRPVGRPTSRPAVALQCQRRRRRRGRPRRQHGGGVNERPRRRVAAAVGHQVFFMSPGPLALALRLLAGPWRALGVRACCWNGPGVAQRARRESPLRGRHASLRRHHTCCWVARGPVRATHPLLLARHCRSQTPHFPPVTAQSAWSKGMRRSLAAHIDFLALRCRRVWTLLLRPARVPVLTTALTHDGTARPLDVKRVHLHRCARHQWHR